MVFSVDMAIKILPVVGQLLWKIIQIISEKKPASIDEEILALNNCRLKNSEDIIAEADKDSS